MAVAVIAVTAVVARLVDRAIARRAVAPEAATRYRVLRRVIVTTIVLVGVLSALLTVPAVRAVAGGILASSAVIAIVVGFAAQRTLSNVISGLLIALSQPLRLGDRVEVDGQKGVVEEIELSYTFIRRDDGSRVVIPNEKLASDTIVNATIVSPDRVAEISVTLPLTTELEPALTALTDEMSDLPGAEVYVAGLDGDAKLAVRVPAGTDADAEQLARQRRLRAHERLRAGGLLA